MENQKGFSLVELLLVCVIIGIVAAVAVPAYQKGMWAAENGSAFSTLRTISQTQVQFYSQNNRFGTLVELQEMGRNNLGATVDGKVIRGRYIFEMSPQNPTPEQLKTSYTIAAIRSVGTDATYRYEVDENGRIRRILPTASEEPF